MLVVGVGVGCQEGEAALSGPQSLMTWWSRSRCPWRDSSGTWTASSSDSTRWRLSLYPGNRYVPLAQLNYSSSSNRNNHNDTELYLYEYKWRWHDRVDTFVKINPAVTLAVWQTMHLPEVNSFLVPTCYTFIWDNCGYNALHRNPPPGHLAFKSKTQTDASQCSHILHTVLFYHCIVEKNECIRNFQCMVIYFSWV